MADNMRDWALFCRANQEHIDYIMDYFHSIQMQPDRGEAILLFLAGMSAGIRGRAIVGESNWTEPVARGWQIGAEEGP